MLPALRGREDYNADFLCMLETWEAAVKFLRSAERETGPAMRSLRQPPVPEIGTPAIGLAAG